MKIAVVGYSGSGKSTLTQLLAAQHGIPFLHLDSVHHLPGWAERPTEDSKAIVEDFLTKNYHWVIDGNYSKLHYQQRMEQADVIILLLFNRFACFFRALHRYFQYRHSTRPDMAQGCQEKFDWHFAWWILKNGRTALARKRYQEVVSMYPEKAIVLKNQRQLDAYIRSL